MEMLHIRGILNVAIVVHSILLFGKREKNKNENN